MIHVLKLNLMRHDERLRAFETPIETRKLQSEYV